MQLSFPLSFLLTTLLFALGQAQGALVKRQPGILTMPLKRLSKNTDVHPVVVSPPPDFLLEIDYGVDPTFPSVCDRISIAVTAVMRG